MQGLFSLETKDETNHYTHKITVPQYEPSKTAPGIEELYDFKKYGKLLQEINQSNRSQEEKQFLRFAAARHIVFNYAKIADYYAHADAEMQRLMEHSALVILDINDAIMNGYVKLSKQLDDILADAVRDDTDGKG